MTSTGEVAELLAESENAVFLTGAGVSKASGMPVFRGEDGLWGDPETNRWAYRHYFDGDPAEWYKSFWQFYDMHKGLAPSAGHQALRDMVEASVVETVVTQNVDSFDMRAGTPEAKLIEVHGHDRALSCADWDEQGCDYNIDTEEWLAANDRSSLPLCPKDGNPLKPDIILLQDSFVPSHIERAYDIEGPEAIAAADTLVAVGTSFRILPWFYMARSVAAQKDRSLVVINPESETIDRYAKLVIHELAEDILPEIRDLVAAT